MRRGERENISKKENEKKKTKCYKYAELEGRRWGWKGEEKSGKWLEKTINSRNMRKMEISTEETFNQSCKKKKPPHLYARSHLDRKCGPRIQTQTQTREEIGSDSRK